jgi:hypothetical protein
MNCGPSSGGSFLKQLRSAEFKQEMAKAKMDAMKAQIEVRTQLQSKEFQQRMADAQRKIRESMAKAQQELEAAGKRLHEEQEKQKK